MNKDEQRKLMAKYLDGSTSLEEERQLLIDNESPTSQKNRWLDCISLQKTAVPDDLSEILWNDFQTKQNRSRNIIGTLVTIFLVLCVAFVISYQSNRKAEYRMKAQLLQEAKLLLSETQHQSEDQEIYYQNDLVTIYLSE